MSYPSREDLFKLGLDRISLFCDHNGVPTPTVTSHEKGSRYDKVNSCGWYRPHVDGGRISIKIHDCARIGTAGRAWSYPGYVTDRTPYGVLAHEVGHHLDVRCNRISGLLDSKDLRKKSGEPPITSYCPDGTEWAAEILRLFITNPDLLRKVRPKTYELLRAIGLKPADRKSWRKVLTGAPDRTIRAAENKITRAPG